MDHEGREMARLERHAVAAFERDLLAELRELALVEVGCRDAVVRTGGLGSIELSITGQNLVLAGVTAQVCAEVGSLADAGMIRIIDAGRYDSRWWIALSDGVRRVVVLALRVQLKPNQGGVHQLVA
jgi:hypothetical protein